MRKFLRSLWFLGRVRTGYLVVIVLGVVPLLALTLGNLLSLAPSADGAPESIDDLCSRADADANQAQPRITAGQRVLDDLAALAHGPFEPGPYIRIANRPRAPGSATESLTGPVRALGSLRDLVEAAAPALSVLPSTAMPQDKLDAARRRVDEVQGSVAKAKSEGVKGLEILETLVKKRLDCFDDCARLIQADMLFKNKQYSPCLERLKERSPCEATSAEADLLARRAEFRGSAEQSANPTWTDPPETWAAAIKEIDSLLKKFSTPPHPDDASLHKELPERRRRLDAWVRFGEASRTQALAKRIEAVHKVVDKYPEAKLNDAARQRLEEWVREGIAEVRVPQSEKDLQESLYRKEVVYVGVFELAGDYYKYWKNKDLQQRERSGYRVLHVDDTTAPGPLTPIGSAEQYASHRQALLREWSSPAAWGRFIEVCGRLQEQMDDYRRHGGDEKGVAFQEVLDFAKDVKSVWVEHVQPLLRQ